MLDDVMERVTGVTFF